MYLRCAVAVALLAALARADNPNSAYAAPAASYGAPAAAPSYAAPAAPSYSAPAASYGAPAASYAAPDAGYGAPTGGASYAAPSYDAPSYDYGYAAPATSGFDLGAIAAFIIPILIAIGLIIAAIIIGGWLLSLLGSAGLAAALAPLVNAILNPLGLSLCTVGPPVAIFPAAAAGRAFADVMAESFNIDLSDDQIAMFSDMAETAVNAIKSYVL